MNRTMHELPPIGALIPEFAAELRQLLVEAGEPALATQVPGLAIFDRCCCGDDFCATFYTKPKPEGSFGPAALPFCGSLIT